MITGLEMLLTIVVLYFAARVNRMEERMNQVEANFNRHLQEGAMEESNTMHMGKAFGNNSTSFRENISDIAKGIKDSVNEVRG